jgi:lipopolysaccharide transport system ATP-binding protein
MSSEFAVRAEGLGKDYLVGSGRRGYDTLRERLTSAAGAPVRALRRTSRPTPNVDVLHALRGLTFTIEQGEAVGFVGHNGAGKSTLLKILSRITEPTRGVAEIRGRVGSLLEVGTGFHPELSGRENIFLNGAILGMTRREIVRRFDEIVAFADVARFLDTPVKRYSSGMYVRLAFSVATHLEPEILMVDEVLAVGDAGFQRRSLRRMAEVAQEGRTVLFVSHNMAVVQALCRRVVVLDSGSVVTDGPTDVAIATYLRSLERINATDLLERTDRGGRGDLLVKAVRVTGGHNGVIRTGEPVEVQVELTETADDLTCALHVYNSLGQPVATLDSATPAAGDGSAEDGCPVFRCEVPELPLVPGSYRIDVTVTGDGYEQDSVPAAALFDVEQGLIGDRAIVRGALGDVAVRHRWFVPAHTGGAGGGS